MHANPALVLNADFRPLSYFPLSLISWQDAVHSAICGEGERCRRIRCLGSQPLAKDQAAIGRGAARIPAVAEACRIYAVQRVSARSLQMPILQRAVRSIRPDIRSCCSALQRRPDIVEQCLCGVPALQRQEGQVRHHESPR